MDDEIEQDGSGVSAAASYDNDREKLLCEWWNRWKEVRDDESAEQWQATHAEEIVALPAHPFVGTNNCALYIEPKPGVAFTTDDPAWKRFAQFSDRLRRKLKRGIGGEGGTPLPQIKKVPQTFLLDGIITTTDTVLMYGGEKEGKSTWAHKLSIVVASDDLDFDGIPVKHGRVLYVSLDSGARKVQVALRMAAICDRLHIEQPERLIVDHDQVFLDDDMSVESMLQRNPGEFVLIVIDPLYRALSGGDPSHAGAVNASIENIIRIQEQTGAAVMILNHDTKAGGMYGSKFWGANADCKIFVERNFKTNVVTVDVELSKNTGALELPPIKYQLESEYLSPIGGDKAKHDEPASATRADMLALIPTEWTGNTYVRKLIEPLFTAPPGEARNKEWWRIREAWELAGLIEQQGRRMRRVK